MITRLGLQSSRVLDHIFFDHEINLGLIYFKFYRLNQIYLATTQLSIVRSTGNPTHSLVKPLITLKSVHSAYSNFIGCGTNYTYTTHAWSVDGISVNCANSRNFKKSSNV